MVGLLLLSAIVLVGCGRGGGGRPANMDERTYNIGMEALGVVDDFLDGRMSAANAGDKIEELRNRLNETEPDDSNERLAHGGLSADFLNARLQLRNIASRGESTTRLLETRNRLARRLNQSER